MSVSCWKPVDFAAVNACCLPRLPELLLRWLPGGHRRGVEWYALNPTRPDRHIGSFSVNTETGRWADFATGDSGGDVISLYAYLNAMGQLAAARALLEDAEAREALTSAIYLPRADEPGLGRLEAALEEATPALAIESALRRAVAEGRLDPAPGIELAEAAVAAGILREEEVDRLASARAARDEAVRVDAFDAKEFVDLHR